MHFVRAFVCVCQRVYTSLLLLTSSICSTETLFFKIKIKIVVVFPKHSRVYIPVVNVEDTDFKEISIQSCILYPLATRKC